jgi:hypothetical protein
LSKERLQKYEDKYERCQRLKNKGFKIGDDIMTHKRTMIDEWKMSWLAGLSLSEKDQEIRRKVLMLDLERKKESMRLYFERILKSP